MIFPHPAMTPNIAMEDPRLIEIAESMRRRILNPPRGVAPNQLEFEAKLGEVMPNALFRQCADQLAQSGQKVPEPVQRLFYQVE